MNTKVVCVAVSLPVNNLQDFLSDFTNAFKITFIFKATWMPVPYNIKALILSLVL